MCLYVILQVERSHLLIVRELLRHSSNNSYFTCYSYSIIELPNLKTRSAPEVCQVQRKWCYWLTRRYGSEVCLWNSWLSIMRLMFCEHSFVSLPEVCPEVFMCSFHQLAHFHCHCFLVHAAHSLCPLLILNRLILPSKPLHKGAMWGVEVCAQPAFVCYYLLV